MERGGIRNRKEKKASDKGPRSKHAPGHIISCIERGASVILSLPILRRSLRVLTLWFGLAALVLQGLAPPGLALSKAGLSGVAAIILCTEHGFQTVHLGADGNPLPATPAGNHENAACTLCCSAHAMAGFMLPPPILLTAPVFIAQDAALFASSVVHAARFYVSYLGRAPPSERVAVP
jgi:hypothetical protein